MQRQKVKKDFSYKGRRCVVLEMNKGGESNFAREILEGPLSSAFNAYCCGYIEVKKNELLDHYDDYPIKSDELTFQATLTHLGIGSKDMVFIGFDSAHAWNDTQPDSKSPNYVAETCKKIVEELNKLYPQKKVEHATN